MSTNKKEEIIFIIIVNFNGHYDTIECLESLLKSNDSNFQIIIIDNSFLAESAEYILSWASENNQTSESFGGATTCCEIVKPIDIVFLTERNFISLNAPLLEKIIIVKSIENKGFAAANNIGLKYLLKFSCFSWVWLLNNDTVVPNNTIQSIRENLSNIPSNIGILGTKIFYYHNPIFLQGVGGKYNKFTSTSTHVAAYKNDYNYDPEIFKKTVDYIIGASMVVKKEFIEDVGPMNDRFFLYYEEIDWALRGKEKGWQIGLIPDALIYHKEGSSISNKTNKISIVADKYFVINRLILTKKFFPKYLFFVYISLIIVFLKRLVRGQSNHIMPILISIFKNSLLK